MTNGAAKVASIWMSVSNETMDKLIVSSSYWNKANLHIGHSMCSLSNRSCSVVSIVEQTNSDTGRDVLSNEPL